MSLAPEASSDDAPRPVSPGDQAPDFEAPGTGGRSYRLSDYRGHVVVLVFYPADFTPVCTLQLASYGHDFDEFAGLGAQLLALSPQSVESHEAFSESLGGLGFPLLADTGKAIGRAYGILGPLGSYRRSVFVIDADGRVTYAHRSAAGRTYRPTAELLEAVRNAG